MTVFYKHPAISLRPKSFLTPKSTPTSFLILWPFLMMGCESKTKYPICAKEGNLATRPANATTSYVIITQGMRRYSDTIYYTKLPNKSENALENPTNGQDILVWCGYDYQIFKTDTSFKAREVAEINSDCGIMRKNDSTYYGIGNFFNLLKETSIGIRKNDSSQGALSEAKWLSEKLIDTNFLGYSAIRSCEEFSYKFKAKYRWNEGKTLGSLRREFDSYEWGYNNCGPNHPNNVDSLTICSDKHFWTDSVDICAKSNHEFSELLKLSKREFSRSSCNRFYHTYYKTEEWKFGDKRAAPISYGKIQPYVTLPLKGSGTP